MIYCFCLSFDTFKKGRRTRRKSPCKYNNNNNNEIGMPILHYFIFSKHLSTSILSMGLNHKQTVSYYNTRVWYILTLLNLHGYTCK